MSLTVIISLYLAFWWASGFVGWLILGLTTDIWLSEPDELMVVTGMGPLFMLVVIATLYTDGKAVEGGQ